MAGSMTTTHSQPDSHLSGGGLPDQASRHRKRGFSSVGLRSTIVAFQFVSAKLPPHALRAALSKPFSRFVVLSAVWVPAGARPQAGVFVLEGFARDFGVSANSS